MLSYFRIKIFSGSYRHRKVQPNIRNVQPLHQDFINHWVLSSGKLSLRYSSQCTDTVPIQCENLIELHLYTFMRSNSHIYCMSCTIKVLEDPHRRHTLNCLKNIITPKPAICTYKAFYLFNTITEYYPQQKNHESLRNWQETREQNTLKIK